MDSAARAKHICNNIIKNIYNDDYKNKNHRNATPEEARSNVDNLVEIELRLKHVFDRQNITPDELFATSADHARIEVLIKCIIDRRDATLM